MEQEPPVYNWNLSEIQRHIASLESVRAATEYLEAISVIREREFEKEHQKKFADIRKPFNHGPFDEFEEKFKAYSRLVPDIPKPIQHEHGERGKLVPIYSEEPGSTGYYRTWGADDSMYHPPRIVKSGSYKTRSGDFIESDDIDALINKENDDEYLELHIEEGIEYGLSRDEAEEYARSRLDRLNDDLLIDALWDDWSRAYQISRGILEMESYYLLLHTRSGHPLSLYTIAREKDHMIHLTRRELQNQVHEIIKNHELCALQQGDESRQRQDDSEVEEFAERMENAELRRKKVLQSPLVFDNPEEAFKVMIDELVSAALIAPTAKQHADDIYRSHFLHESAAVERGYEINWVGGWASYSAFFQRARFFIDPHNKGENCYFRDHFLFRGEARNEEQVRSGVRPSVSTKKSISQIEAARDVASRIFKVGIRPSSEHSKYTPHRLSR